MFYLLTFNFRIASALMGQSCYRLSAEEAPAQMMSQTLITQMNRRFGFAAIGRIRLRQDLVRATRTRYDSLDQQAEQQQGTVPLHTLEKVTSQIHNPELRARVNQARPQYKMKHPPSTFSLQHFIQTRVQQYFTRFCTSELPLGRTRFHKHQKTLYRCGRVVDNKRKDPMPYLC